MEELVQPERLRDRILFWVKEAIRQGEIPPKGSGLLRRSCIEVTYRVVRWLVCLTAATGMRAALSPAWLNVA